MASTKRPLLVLITLALSAVALSACAAPADPLDAALACLQEKGVDAEIRDGALVVTQLAKDSSDVDVDAAVEECVPAELRGR